MKNELPNSNNFKEGDRVYLKHIRTIEKMIVSSDYHYWTREVSPEWIKYITELKNTQYFTFEEQGEIDGKNYVTLALHNGGIRGLGIKCKMYLPLDFLKNQDAKKEM